MKKAIVLFVLALGFVRAASASAEEEIQTYVVQWGDRLERVAGRYGLTEEELLAANPRSVYGIKCGNPSTLTLRNGEQQAICGGDRPYLIAEKTLIIPEPRILLQARNVQLDAELVVLRAEMEKARQELEAGKSALAEARQERDDLVSERDDLRDENKTFVAEKAELQGKYSESRSDFVAVSSRQPKEVEVQKTNYVQILLAVAITSFFAILVIMIVSYCKSKKFNRLVQLVQPSLIEQAAKNKKRGAEIDKLAKELEIQRTALDELRRETEKLKADLDARDASLKTAADELDQRDQQLRGRNGDLNGRETRLYLREENLSVSQRLLEDARRALRQDRVTHHDEARRLTAARDRVEAGLRALEEDGPALTRDRQAVERQVGEVTQRISAVVVREIDARSREEAATSREKAATEREEELSRRKSLLDDEVAVIAARKKDLQKLEEDVRNLEGALVDKQTALQTAKEEHSRREAEFEEQRAAAEHLIEVAGGLLKAERILKRSKRKEAEVQALDEREKKLVERETTVAKREAASDTREGALRAWEERRGDLSDDTDDGEETRRLPPPLPDEGSITHLDPPGSEPVMDVSTVLCPDCGNEVPFGRLDEHRAAAHSVSVEVESSGPETCRREDGREVVLTSPEAHLGSCVPASITCGGCGRNFADRREFDEHRTGCPEAVPHTPTMQGPSATHSVTNLHDTDLEIPMASEPSREESGFYCAVCHRAFSAEEYDRDHAAHNPGLPKPD